MPVYIKSATHNLFVDANLCLTHNSDPCVDVTTVKFDTTHDITQALLVCSDWGEFPIKVDIGSDAASWVFIYQDKTPLFLGTYSGSQFQLLREKDLKDEIFWRSIKKHHSPT